MAYKTLDWSALFLSGLGAVNIGTSKLGFDLLGYIPSGIFNTIVLWAVAASGAYVVVQLIRKKL